MNYLLDTNIVLLYARNNDFTKKLEEKLKLFSNNKNLVISVVTVGEAKAFAKKNRWGENKTNSLIRLLNNFLVADINIETVIERYADLDAYSQGKFDKVSFTARNMGKNDLWIAATASVYDFKLLTTDNDFNHLDEVYLDLQNVSLTDFKN